MYLIQLPKLFLTGFFNHTLGFPTEQLSGDNDISTVSGGITLPLVPTECSRNRTHRWLCRAWEATSAIKNGKSGQQGVTATGQATAG